MYEHFIGTDPDQFETYELFWDYYLAEVGLTWPEIEGKCILEIGGGNGGFAKAAKARGIEVITVDRDPDMHPVNDPDIDVEVLVQDSRDMEIPDATFDLVISRAGPPIVHRNKDYIFQTIHEALRVLKPGGEFRFGPGVFFTDLFEPEDLLTFLEMKWLMRDDKFFYRFLHNKDIYTSLEQRSEYDLKGRSIDDYWTRLLQQRTVEASERLMVQMFPTAEKRPITSEQRKNTQQNFFFLLKKDFIV
jgi:SAM-dependent methyltransferase